MKLELQSTTEQTIAVPHKIIYKGANMFLQNEHHDEYFNIIFNAKLRGDTKPSRSCPNYIYYEKHHIIPKSLGGSNDGNNLVLLTAQEHYRCHEILPLFTSGKYRKSMLYAWNMMSRLNGVKIDYTIYEKHKQEFSLIVSSNTTKTLTGRKHSQETINKMSKSALARPKPKSVTPQARQNMSSSHMGNKHSQETINKMSKSALARPKPQKYQCECCGGMFTKTNLLRWHGENCRYK